MHTPEWMKQFPGIFLILMFNDSRKVGFGLWLFIVATTLLFYGPQRMTLDMWQNLALIAGFLIGGGTLADTWLTKKKNDAPPPPAQ